MTRQPICATAQPQATGLGLGLGLLSLLGLVVPAQLPLLPLLPAAGYQREQRSG